LVVCGLVGGADTTVSKDSHVDAPDMLENGVSIPVLSKIINPYFSNIHAGPSCKVSETLVCQQHAVVARSIDAISHIK
jgi:hypothetical protein